MGATTLPSHDQAFRAVRRMQEMIPMLTGFARALTGKHDIVVKIVGKDGTPSTDGTVIYMRPHYGLGEIIDHDRLNCGRRDERGLQWCGACRQQDDVLGVLFHEMSHIIFGTFDQVNDQDREDMVTRAVAEWPGQPGTRVRKLEQLIEEARRTGRVRLPDGNEYPISYMMLANLISPYLPMIFNCLEDSRVNRLMFTARPGVYWMFNGTALEAFEKGVELPDGTISHWSEREPDMQVMIGLYCITSNYDFTGWFSPEVEMALHDPQLRALVARFMGIRTVAGVYRLGFPILERLREMGYCKAPADVVDDPPPMPPPPAPDQDADEAQPNDDKSNDPQKGENDGADPNDEPSDEQEDGGSSSDDEQSTDDADDDDQLDGESDSSDDDGDADSDSESGDGESDEADGEESDAGDDDGDGASESDDQEAGDEDTLGDGEATDAGTNDDAEDSTDSDVPAPGSSDDDEADADPQDGEPSDSTGDDTDDAADADMDNEQSVDSDDEHMDSDGSTSQEADASTEDGESDGERTDDGEVEPDESDPEFDPDAAPKTADPVAVEHALREFMGHAEDNEPDPLQEAIDEVLNDAVDSAATQDEYSETIAGVKVLDDGLTGRGWGSDHNDIEAYRVPETVIGPNVFSLRKVFADNKRAGKVQELRSGRVSANRLATVPTGNRNVFNRTLNPTKKDYFVVLALDISGSTSGHKIEEIKAMGFMVGEMLNRVGVKFMIAGHAGSSHDSRSYGSPGYDERDDVDIYLVKGERQPWDTAAKQRMASLRACDWNLDGHAVEYFRKRMDESSATNKVLIYVTDGKMPEANFDDELHVLKRELKTMAQRNYAMVGVGMGTDSPRKHGLTTVRIDSMIDIKKLVDELSKQLGVS